MLTYCETGVKHTKPIYIKNTVVSKDGTLIGYRQLGKGPGVILVHGGLKSSQDFMKLAHILSHTFTVYIPDRRGRGMSGPAGDSFGVEREVEDMQALIAKTGAANIFGLSAGALVTLKTAWATPSLRNVALYEPPYSVNGSAPTSWVKRYKRELAKGKLANALVTGMQGLATVPVFTKIPRFLLAPMLAVVMMFQGKSTEEKVTIRSLVPTWQNDMKVIDEMSDTLDDYKDLRANILLLGGTKSPAWLMVSLDSLNGISPRVNRFTFEGLGHDGPEDDGNPELVAAHLSRFFGTDRA